MGYRILYLGNDWYGSCARACGYALRRLGHEVIDVSADRYTPGGKRFLTKAAMRLTRPLLEREFNDQVLDTAKRLQPDFLLTFKGCMVYPETLQVLRKHGLPLYQYYPDNSVFAHQNVYPETMGEYDCCFFTKKFLIEDTQKKIALRDAVYLPHGYDPDLHRITEVSEEDRQVYGCDVLAVMTHTPGKEQFMDELLATQPNLDLKVWGGVWSQRCKSPRVKAKSMGVPLTGQAYAKAIRAAKINLALLSEEATGASSGDQTTTRTYEIPACGGFMLHHRTAELAQLFEEDREVACFGSPREALEKIDFYLQNEEKRKAIAEKGHERAVPAYSYDSRMQFVLDYHCQRRKLSRAANL